MDPGSVPRAVCGQYDQQGSLLIFPLITIDPSIASDTTVQISNDQVSSVVVECEYINEQKARVDFLFTLSGKATASWDVGAVKGDTFTPPRFQALALIRPSAPRKPANWSASRSRTRTSRLQSCSTI